MRALVLWASDASPNLGVRALAEGAAQLVRRVDPDASVSYYHHGPTDAPVRVGSFRSFVRELTPANRGFVRWLAEFDVVVDTRSGDSFADIYGLPRHTTMTAVGELCARAGVPLVMAPQTIGPFATRRGRLLADRTLRTAALVMARDPRSAEEAAARGRPVDVLTTDVVFALDVPEVATTRDVVLNVSGLLSRSSPHVDAEEYRRTVRSVVHGLVDRGRRVSLLAHVLDSPHHDNDVPAVRELGAEFGPGVEVVVPTGLAEVRQVVRGASLVIGSRMHACLNALSVGTPAIAMAYSRKFDPLLAELGWEHCVDLRTDRRADEGVLGLVERQDELTEQARRVRHVADDLLVPAIEALGALMTAHR